MLLSNVKNQIGVELEALFQPIADYPGQPVPADLTEKLSQIIKKNTGINTKWIYIDQNVPDMAIYSKIYFGHQSSRYVSDPTLLNSQNFDKNTQYIKPFNDLMLVDLERFYVSGPLADTFIFECYIFAGILNFGLTSRELTAAVLHECGHLFNTIAAMGEYVYLSYLMQQGIEDLAEQRPGSLAVEVMSDVWVKENVSKDLYEAYVHDRSYDNARKVVLGSIRNLPRFHLTNSKQSAKAKEEQLADSYPTRLGYGRDQATMINKLHKFMGENALRSKMGHYIIQIIAAPFIFVNLPILYLIYDLSVSSYTHNFSYDKPVDRLKNIKTTMIADLKKVQDDHLKKALVNDIDAVDELISTYYDNCTFLDAIMYFLSPDYRKDSQRNQHEKTLERLMNNDLFHLSAKLR